VPLILGCLSFCLCLLVRVPTLAAFTVEFVDTLGSVGAPSSVIVDPTGVVHVGYRYYAPFQGDLRYARKSNGAWAIETASGYSTDEGMGTSIALDGAGQPWLSHLDGLGVYCSRREGETWSATYVGSTTQLSGSTSLGFDGEGAAHVVYPSRSVNDDFDLVAATDTGGAFVLETAAEFGTFPSAKVEPGGRVHISCYNGATGRLHCITGAGAWTSEVVDAIGGSSSLALSAEGEPCISYQQGWQGPLCYARKTAGTWDRETVDGPGDFGQSSAIAMDALGNPHIAYYDGSGGNLKHAVRLNSAWIVEIVDSVGDVGKFCSVAIGPQGSVHFSYYDATGKNLKYAVSDASTGVTLDTEANTLRLWPNPAAGGRVSLASPPGSLNSTRDIDVYDVSGRLVRSLRFPIGIAQVEWDGRDEGGRSVSAGTYFLRSASFPDARVTLIR
jgi:hypothetical protein